MPLFCLVIFGYILRVPCHNNKWFHVTWFSVMTLAPSFEHLLMVPVLFSPDYWSARWCSHFPRWSLPASFIPRSATGNSFPNPHKGTGQTYPCFWPSMCVKSFFWGSAPCFLGARNSVFGPGGHQPLSSDPNWLKAFLSGAWGIFPFCIQHMVKFSLVKSLVIL